MKSNEKEKFEYLYVEIDDNPPEEYIKKLKEQQVEDKEERGVIIIDMF